MFIFVSIWAYVESFVFQESLRGIACWEGFWRVIWGLWHAAEKGLLKDLKALMRHANTLHNFSTICFFFVLQVKNLTNVKFAARVSRNLQTWSHTAESTQVQSAISIVFWDTSNHDY